MSVRVECVCAIRVIALDCYLLLVVLHFGVYFHEVNYEELDTEVALQTKSRCRPFIGQSSSPHHLNKNVNV